MQAATYLLEDIFDREVQFALYVLHA